MSTFGSLRDATDRSEVRLTDVPRTTAGTVDVDALYREFADAILLEDATGKRPTYIVVGGAARFQTIATGSTLATPAGVKRLARNPMRALDEVCDIVGVSWDTDATDTAPLAGLTGAFAYELGQFVEPITATQPAGLLASLRVTDTVIAIDPTRETCDLLLAPTRFQNVRASQRIVQILAARRHSSSTAGTPARVATPLASNLTAAEYYRIVGRIKQHIADGAVFQVNFTQQFSAALATDLHRLYQALRQQSPAPYGAVIPECGVAAVSPETFLRVDGSRVETRPIKGTRRRDDSAAVDAALADDLATSAKDHAENVMVVDMERNDLGRVCVPGSVHVPALTQVVAHPTVWHLESSVVGELRHDATYGALLQATFPCGSITGAPKRAAMQYIAMYEPDPRGFYCGAFGYLAPGCAELAVAIRTAQYDGVTARFGAGGGVVADSTATGEYLESLEKAELFRRAVNGVFPLATS